MPLDHSLRNRSDQIPGVEAPQILKVNVDNLVPVNELSGKARELIDEHGERINRFSAQI